MSVEYTIGHIKIYMVYFFLLSCSVTDTMTKYNTVISIKSSIRAGQIELLSFMNNIHFNVCSKYI